MQEFDYTNIIRDSNGVPIIDENSDITPSEFNDKKFLVHCTDYFPKDGIIYSKYDTKSEGYVNISYGKIMKSCRTMDHRHTVHFTINAKAESNGFGNWDTKKYILFDPLDNHKDVSFNESESDYYCYGSLPLSSDAILLVREDCYDTLPSSFISKFKVFKYRGNPSECVKSFLHRLGVNLVDINSMDAGHYNSFEHRQEKILKNRDAMINFYKDNTYTYGDDLKLTIKDLDCLYDIDCHNFGSGILSNVFLPEYLLSKGVTDIEEQNFMCFLANFGIKKNQDGTYSLKDDEEVFNNIKDNDTISLDELNDIRADFILYQRDKMIPEEFNKDMFKISDVFSMYNSYKENYKTSHVLKDEYFKEQEIDDLEFKNFCQFVTDFGIKRSFDEKGMLVGFTFDDSLVKQSILDNSKVDLNSVKSIYAFYNFYKRSNSKEEVLREKDIEAVIDLSSYTIGDLFKYKNLKACSKMFDLTDAIIDLTNSSIGAKNYLVYANPVISESELSFIISNLLKNNQTVDKFSVPSDMNANEALEKLKKRLPERLYSAISREHELNEALKQEVDDTMELADVKKDSASL